MADIQMCLDDSCPSRTTCKRHVASGTPWSEYGQAVGGTLHDSRGKCDAYWEYKANLPNGGQS